MDATGLPTLANHLFPPVAGFHRGGGGAWVRMLGRFDTGALLEALAPHFPGPSGWLYVADGGNCFTPYGIAQWARRAGLEPGEVLGRVMVSRAFTIHQLGAIASEMLVPLGLGKQGAPLAVLFLGLDHLFLEESLEVWERRHVLGGVLEQMALLGGAGVLVMAVHDPPRHGDGEWWVGMVRGSDGG